MNLKFLPFVNGLIILVLNSVAFSQEKITVEEYIDLYKDIAIKEMKSYHIPASITIAQGILESDNGNSLLARKANNHFGIKCHKEWNGKTFHQDDDEKDECFRKYGNPEDSFRDHSEFLSTRDRYRALFDLELTDYKGWANGLKQAGYATNPRYADLLIRIIEDNELYKFDKAGSRRPDISDENSEPRTRSSELHSGPPQVFEIAGRGGHERVIFLNNGIKFFIAREGDNAIGIAAEFGIYSWQILAYNELSKHDKIIPGEKVYLERKRKRAGFDYHIVQPGESLRSIAQDYGIRMKALNKLNDKKNDEKLMEGERLLMR